MGVIRPVSTEEFLQLEHPILDVRSPAEHQRGHIPGSIAFPLFSDEERAVVGTAYKQQGRDQAVLEGLRLIGPRMAPMVEQARRSAPGLKVRVHCWRGGERSGSVAWLLDKAGFTEVFTLKGGYKQFRSHVLSSFERPWDLRVLGGYTGTGKTGILKALHAQGEQVIDLEAIAHHKGSAFGALGQPPQPTTEHFEALLWNELRKADGTRPIWVEDESLMIGTVRIPEGFFARMRSAHLFFMELPLEIRAHRLVSEYGVFSKEELGLSIQRIGKRLGPQHVKAALEALADGDLLSVALITLRYYDKAYLRGITERDPSMISRMSIDTDSHRTASILRKQISTHV